MFDHLLGKRVGADAELTQGQKNFGSNTQPQSLRFPIKQHQFVQPNPRRHIVTD